MLNFEIIKKAVNQQMKYMLREYDHIFRVDLNKDELWEVYLASFDPADNPMYRERTEHDCQCCKHFIRNCGDMVAVTKDNKLVSIWDIDIIGGYKVVAEALSNFVKSKDIQSIFLHHEKTLGKEFSHEMKPGQDVVTWPHFHYMLPAKVVNKEAGSKLSQALSDHNVLKRGLKEISISSIKLVLDLIKEQTLYRGDEHTKSLNLFLKILRESKKVSSKDFDIFAWRISQEIGMLSRFRNSVIGTLVLDISNGVELEDAVRMFEAKVAPENYKRTKALVTPAMIKLAKKKVAELNLMDSLPRRYAVEDDITINNVLFADKAFIGEASDIFDNLLEKAKTYNLGNLKNAKEVTEQEFLMDIMPQASNIEVLLENRLEHNMFSLIAPMNREAPNLFKWNNGFSWAYNGDVADSMKDRVKALGGKTEGVLRFSIQWNDEGDNHVDFDAHCFEPTNGTHIYFNNKATIHRSSGMLDVDIISPGSKVAVENIIWTNLEKMPSGEYLFKVHNYSGTVSNGGFTAEIEFDGQIHSFVHTKNLRGGEYVTVAKISLHKKEGFRIKESLKSTKASRNIWGIPSNTFREVSLIMNSPNYWDSQKIGNKHLFFVLKGCNNGSEARGFYNEFLGDDLHANRKTFELLGSEMKVCKSDKQLSGVGFSSTQRNHMFCRVTKESSVRIFKINF